MKNFSPGLAIFILVSPSDLHLVPPAAPFPRCSLAPSAASPREPSRNNQSTAINGNANNDCGSNYKREKGLELELSIVNKSKFCREDVGGFSWVLKVEVNSLLSFLVFTEPSSLPRERAFKKVSFLCEVLVLQPCRPPPRCRRGLRSQLFFVVSFSPIHWCHHLFTGAQLLMCWMPTSKGFRNLLETEKASLVEPVFSLVGRFESLKYVCLRASAWLSTAAGLCIIR